MQIKQNFFTMERAFLSQETFTSANYTCMTNLLARCLAGFSLGQDYVSYLTTEQINSKIKMLFLYTYYCRTICRFFYI